MFPKMDSKCEQKKKILKKIFPCLVPIDEEENGNPISDPTVRYDNPQKCQQHECHPKIGSTFRSLSIKLVRFIEHLCGLWGFAVGSYPMWACGICLVFVSLLGLGIFNMNIVYRPYDLWVPSGSEFTQVTQWKIQNFPPRFRKQVGIWESENVLTSSVVKKIWSLHLAVESMEVTYQNKSYTWKDVCLQFPADYSQETRELASHLDSDYVCYEASILELWGYDDTVINNLTDQMIIDDINSINRSRLYGTETNFTSYLSGIERDADGRIVKARAILHTWLTRVNSTAIEDGHYSMDVATGDKVDLLGLLWEKHFVKEVENQVTGSDVSLNLRAGYTLSEVLHTSITQDVLWIIVGWILLIIYVVFTIGKPFSKDNRIIPACVGLVAIALAVLASYGACSLMRIPYGTLTNVLPVLLVALGVDDMYVIVTAWDKISRNKPELCDVALKAQETMEHAGMAITVTSLTNILAFAVGTITTLPGLKWFCFYSVVGISVVYVLQGTLFVASMVINQNLTETHDFSLPVKLPVPQALSDKELKWKIKHAFNFWCNFIMKPFSKVIIILLVVVVFSLSLINVSNMSKKFDTMWLIPKTSKLYYWYKDIESMFPLEGEKGAVYFKGVHLPQDIPNLINLTRRLEDLPYIDRVDAWFKGLNPDEIDEQYEMIKGMSPDLQCELLLSYIDIKYRSHFQEILNDAEDSGDQPCSLFLLEFKYIPLKDQNSKQVAMHKVREVVKNTNISGYKAAWAHAFSYWETDKIIMKELLQSLSVVLTVVGLISLILLASLRASFLVIVCVIITLVDVASFVHIWGLTINTITSLAFVLAVGICVDYATHIAHDFLLVEGTRDQRAKSAILQMGFAVFHGGCSTLIAFLLLAPSGSYIFISYFKILTGVSLFGLFHALVFLPVMLSLIGPDPYPPLEGGDTPDTQSPPPVSSLPPIIPKYTYRYSADVSSVMFYLPEHPPPYEVFRPGLNPPLYKRSNSLPCLTLEFSHKSGDSLRNINCTKDTISGHSRFCTKL